MASWSSSSPSLPTPPTIGDCPQCGSLCLGALLLPCGHLTCRVCIRHHHGSQLICQLSQHPLPLPKGQGSTDFVGLVESLGVDPIMIRLVNNRLIGQRHLVCVFCANREATTICQDCKEQYCDDCSKGHKRLEMSKDHVLQPLPQATQDTSSPSYTISTPRTDSASPSASLESICSPLGQWTPHDISDERDKCWKQWVDIAGERATKMVDCTSPPGEPAGKCVITGQGAPTAA